MEEIVAGLVLFTILFVSVACNARAGNELNKLPGIDGDWYKLAIELGFDNKKYTYQLIKLFGDESVGSAKNYAGVLYKNSFVHFKPVLDLVKENAFSDTFADIYQGIRSGEFDEHEFTGVQFELDDDPATQEWFVAFQFNACSNRNAGEALAVSCGDKQIHSWLIQLQEDGEYHLLMEADGLMDISGHAMSQDYKSITTYAFNEHNYLSAPGAIPEIGHPPCGRGVIEWGYQNGKYEPLKLTPVKGSCDLRFMADNETITAFSERTEAGIRRYLAVWLEKVAGRNLPQFQ